MCYRLLEVGEYYQFADELILSNEKVNAYANDTQKTLISLSDYAKKLRVYNKVMDIMEILLHSWYIHIELLRQNWDLGM